MPNPVTSLRLPPYVLARALRAIRTIEPSWQFTTRANLIKTVIEDYIAKTEHQHHLPLTISEELLNEVMQNKQGSIPAKQFKQLGKSQALTPQTDNRTIKQRLLDEQAQAIITSSDNPAEPIDSANSTDSVINTVDDFTPPTEWKE